MEIETGQPQGFKDTEDYTRADRDLLRAYLVELRKTPLLSATQEVELAKAREAGLYAAHKLQGDEQLTSELSEDLAQLVREGAEAQDLLLRANLRLVVSIAKRYTRKGSLAFLDLIQEGNLGLMKAVERFDYAKGFKFSTYATWWIRQAITHAIAEHARTIRIPVHMLEDINRFERAKRDLDQDFERNPTAQEVANFLGITVEKVLEMEGYSREPVSLDMPVGDEGEDTLADFAGAHDDPGYRSIEAEHVVASILQTLNAREQQVIRMRYGLRPHDRSHTLDEVAEELKRLTGKELTRQRISQIEQVALKKMNRRARLSVEDLD